MLQRLCEVMRDVGTSFGLKDRRIKVIVEPVLTIQQAADATNKFCTLVETMQSRRVIDTRAKNSKSVHSTGAQGNWASETVKGLRKTADHLAALATNHPTCDPSALTTLGVERNFSGLRQNSGFPSQFANDCTHLVSFLENNDQHPTEVEAHLIAREMEFELIKPLLRVGYPRPDTASYYQTSKLRTPIDVQIVRRAVE